MVPIILCPALGGLYALLHNSSPSQYATWILVGLFIGATIAANVAQFPKRQRVFVKNEMLFPCFGISNAGKILFLEGRPTALRGSTQMFWAFCPLPKQADRIHPDIAYKDKSKVTVEEGATPYVNYFEDRIVSWLRYFAIPGNATPWHEFFVPPGTFQDSKDIAITK